MNYEKIYYQIIDKAKNRINEGYTEKHHIIPKCMNGTNDKENIVSLTAKEHFICHRLLCEMYPENTKLKYAYYCMHNLKNEHQENRNYKIYSNEYERLKYEIYNIRLKNKKWDRTGSKHSQETIEKIKIARSKQTFSEETRKKFSENAKRLHSNGIIKGNGFKPIKCILNDINFNSLTEASHYFDVSITTIQRKIKSGGFIEKIDITELELKYTKEIKENIIIDNKEFKTIKEAADYIGIHESVASYRLINGLNILEKGSLRKRKCKILGFQFDSITDAVNTLKIPRTTLMRKINNINETDYVYL